MIPLTRELHGIPLPDLVGYLIGLGGQTLNTQEGQPVMIAGPGWHAAISRLPDYRLGQAAFCSYQVEMQGDAEPVRQAWTAFNLRVMRPGG